MKTTVLLLAIAVVGCGPSLDGSQPNRAERTRTYLAALASTGRTPGIQYRVVNAGGVVFEHDGGWANLARRLPVDRHTTMMAYSMSKTITAIAVLQLVEAGRLALGDPANRFVAMPYGPAITIRQLLSHTAGLPNPIPLAWVHRADDHARFDERQALDAVLRDHPGRSSDPGAKYAYSNIGYWLLGGVIERVSGEPLPSYVATHIARPLGLTPLDFGYVVADPARQATGYLEKYSLMNLLKGFLIDRSLVGDYSGTWLEIRAHYPNGPAFGGVVATARAFGVLLQDQLRDESVLLRQPTRALLYTPQRTATGRTTRMTLGWHVGALGDRRFFYKEGGGGGFHCLMRLYPDDGIGSVVMTNATGFDVTTLLDTVDPGFLVPGSASP